MRVRGFMREWLLDRRAWRALWFRREGAQLLEFALVLPLLIVLVVGIADFGAGYALKDKLSNAAREGARIAVSQPDDLTNSQNTACNTAPCSVLSAANAAVVYLKNAGVNVCGLDPTSITPTGSLSAGWTYAATQGCPAPGMSVLVERSVSATVNGNTVLLTRVTISYPFKWTFGNVIKLLIPESQYSTTLTLSSVAVMQNLN
jgi:Flp pilus assembly protein TadG